MHARNCIVCEEGSQAGDAPAKISDASCEPGCSTNDNLIAFLMKGPFSSPDADSAAMEAGDPI
jgi:hypothetical protein